MQQGLQSYSHTIAQLQATDRQNDCHTLLQTHLWHSVIQLPAVQS
jgi:hypothetical protein